MSFDSNDYERFKALIDSLPPSFGEIVDISNGQAVIELAGRAGMILAPVEEYAIGDKVRIQEGKIEERLEITNIVELEI
jgi:hypothetical protein